MKLATSTNIFFNRPNGQKASLEECLRYCGEAGYKRMDISFLDYCNFKAPFVDDDYQKWIEKIMSIADSYGIVFSQGHAPFYNFCDERTPDKTVMDKMILRSIDCASMMGIPWMAIHAGTDYSAADLRRSSMHKNREYFLPLLEYAEKKNVGIAFENLWDYNIAPKKRYTAIIEDLIELVDSFACSNAGICYDVEHAAISGLDPAKEVALIGKRLKSTHISDFLDIKADHLLPFDGGTDWKSFMKALKRIGYEGDIAYEIHRYTEFTPEPLILDAMKYSIKVGNYLLALAEEDEKV